MHSECAGIVCVFICIFICKCTHPYEFILPWCTGEGEAAVGEENLLTLLTAKFGFFISTFMSLPYMCCNVTITALCENISHESCSGFLCWGLNMRCFSISFYPNLNSSEVKYWVDSSNWQNWCKCDKHFFLSK